MMTLILKFEKLQCIIFSGNVLNMLSTYCWKMRKIFPAAADFHLQRWPFLKSVVVSDVVGGWTPVSLPPAYRLSHHYWGKTLEHWQDNIQSTSSGNSLFSYLLYRCFKSLFKINYFLSDICFVLLWNVKQELKKNNQCSKNIQ